MVYVRGPGLDSARGVRGAVVMLSPAEGAHGLRNKCAVPSTLCAQGPGHTPRRKECGVGVEREKVTTVQDCVAVGS